ncbi:MAG: hypothetical protein ACI8VW_003394 [bacterium]|jgi:hypothetical protein
MKDFDEQYAELQKNMEPMQEMNTVAVQAFERIARKNYELMGDLVEFAVAQVQIPQGKATAQEVFEHQSAEAKAFAEKVNARAAEYMELAGELGGMVSATTEAGAASTSKDDTASKPNPTAKKASGAKKTAKKAAAKKSAS